MIITDKEIQNFKSDLKKLCHALELKYDVLIKPGNATYNKDKFELNVTVLNNDSGEDIDVMELEFRSLCKRYGFKEEDYEKEIVVENYSGPRRFAIVGFKPKARKYKYLVKHVDELHKPDAAVYKVDSAKLK